jgi:hypothetical protein
MLYKDFEPSSPWPSPEEVNNAHALLKEAVRSGTSTPQAANDIFTRYDQAAHEQAVFMRDDTQEIIDKMLPQGTSLTVDKMMDMLHVYFWWKFDIGLVEPAEYFEDLLRDLDTERFAEAVDLIHAEFAEDCYKHRYDYESESDTCMSPSGMECFTWYVSLNNPDTVQSIIDDPWERSDKLKSMFFESIFGDEDEFGESPDDESMLSDEMIIDLNIEPRTHTLQRMLGQHAIRRLVEAGVEDIEAMDATAVLGMEEDLRSVHYDTYTDYKVSRDAGNDLDAYLHSYARLLMQDKKSMKVIVEEFAGPGIKLSQIPTRERKDLVKRFIIENRDDFEKLETIYQLKEHGISPFYRRRMSEDNFPADERE